MQLGNVTHGQIALRVFVDAPAGTRQGMRLRQPLLRWTCLRSLPLPRRERAGVEAGARVCSPRGDRSAKGTM